MKIVLLLFDLIFYLYMLWSTAIGFAGVIILIGLSVLSWAISSRLYEKRSKGLLFAGVGANVAVLAFFKYFGGVTGFIMPLGLSFYSFALISLLADAYGGKLQEKPRLTDTLAYAGFFATILSGPIIKARDFMKDIRAFKGIDRAGLNEGMWRIIRGLFEKLVIADRLGIAVDAVYGTPAAYSGLSLFMASVTYSLQIYCDFAGYSNIAIGLGRILGFTLPENFDLPYMAKNPSDFWKRWHISLSSWLTEYIYIPLGGSRKGRLRKNINIMITMLVSGLWHGSTVNFLIWGALHGLWQVGHSLLPKDCKKENKAVNIIKTVLTFLAVNLLWIPFRAPDLAACTAIVGRIFTMAEGVNYVYSYTLIFGAMLVIYEIFAGLRMGCRDRVWTFDLGSFKGKLILLSAILAIALFAYFGNTAFIYSNF